MDILYTGLDRSAAPALPVPRAAADRRAGRAEHSACRPRDGVDLWAGPRGKVIDSAHRWLSAVRPTVILAGKNQCDDKTQCPHSEQDVADHREIDVVDSVAYGECQNRAESHENK